MSGTYTQSFEFTLTHCSECGIPFGVLSHLHATASQQGRKLTCPNGHVFSPQPVVVSQPVPVVPVFDRPVFDPPVSDLPVRAASVPAVLVGVSNKRMERPPLRGDTKRLYDWFQENPGANNVDAAGAMGWTVVRTASIRSYITRWENMTSEQVAAQYAKLANMRENFRPGISMREKLLSYLRESRADTDFMTQDLTNHFPEMSAKDISSHLSVLQSRGQITRERLGVYRLSPESGT